MNQHAPGDFDHLNQSALEVEQGLLGACLTYPMAAHAAITQKLEPEHFNEEVHRLIWSAITDLALAGTIPSPVTLGPRLGNAEIAPNFTMRQYLAKLSVDSFCPANAVVDFARQIMRGWALRNVALLGSEASASALEPGADAGRIISEAIQNLDGIRATLDRKAGGPRDVGMGTEAIRDKMERRMVGEVVDAAVSTGLRDLDRRLGGGFKNGQLVLVAGRPGMGKTLLGASMARQMAKLGTAGGFFSLEMPEEQICARLLSDEIFGSGRLTANDILQRALSNDEAEMVIDASAAIAGYPLKIDDSGSLTVGEVGARARTMRSHFDRAGKPLGFLVIDYLKFLRASERYRGQRHYEVGEISGGLKTLAKDLGIPIILLAQLNREVEKRAEKRPELSDLRESGDLEADADVVLLLYREAYYLANDAKTNPDAEARLEECKFKLEIIVAKQRMGEVGPVPVFCHPGASAVRDLGHGR